MPDSFSSSAPVRWIALVEHADHVCCRYRLRAFAPSLAAAGHLLEIQPLPRTWWRRLALFRQLQGANVVLQRRLLPGWQLALLRRAARQLLYDFDDALFCRDSYAVAGLEDRRRLHRFTATVRACDAVIAGNSFLRDAVHKLTPGTPVTVIPTCVEPALYPVAAHHRLPPEVQMVWVGSSSTLQGLERIRPLLEEIGRRLPGVSLKLICDRFLTLQALRVQEVPWRGDREAEEIAGADLGISWAPDDAWSRGKCGLKVLQYMAGGLPVVANPVGVHLAMVRPGLTGFLARTQEEWLQAITCLAGDPHLRRHLGQAGRNVVSQEYSVTVGASRWQELLDRLASSQPVRDAG